MATKKKATMTLKDFHGGSIPSDLPLPSAPGVSITRPASDRGGFDRQTSWGNSMGRPDHRLRPASAGSTRTFDDKTPFLSHSSHIGRNFDEDERKPLDGLSGPRRTVSDESIRAQPTPVVGPKADNLHDASGSRPTTVSASHVLSGSSYAGRVGDVHHAGFNNQNISGSHGFGWNNPNTGGNSGQAGVGAYPNAWGIRKGTIGLKEPVSAPWSAPDAATKLAHASALEKISSGRWNPKQVHLQKDGEILGQMERDREFHYRSNKTYHNNNYDRLGAVGDADSRDASLVIHAERSLAIDDGIRGGPKERPTYEKFKPTVNAESFEGSSSINDNGPHLTVKSGGPEFQSTLPVESSERPKLKLLPRSKPLESSEPPVDYKQGPSVHVHVEDGRRLPEPMLPVQPVSPGLVVSDRAPERPKLNLKPRSQPLEQQEASGENRRETVFGGARPRELVLKDRGIEDVPVSNYENQSPLRVKEDVPKVDTSMHAAPRHVEKQENIHGDQRMAKHAVKRGDQQLDGERRNNRRNEIWRNNRDVEQKHRNQQQPPIQHRPTSPETWRKPVEHAKSSLPDAPPMRYGKVASAVELAQAFSKSVSDPALNDHFPGSRGLAGRSQVPFSRLMGPNPRPQINGY